MAQEKIVQALRPRNRVIALVIGADPAKFPRQGHGAYVAESDKPEDYYQERYIPIAEHQQAIDPPFHLGRGDHGIVRVRRVEEDLKEINLPGWRSTPNVSADEGYLPMVDFDYLRQNGGPNFAHAQWAPEARVFVYTPCFLVVWDEKRARADTTKLGYILFRGVHRDQVDAESWGEGPFWWGNILRGLAIAGSDARDRAFSRPPAEAQREKWTNSALDVNEHHMDDEHLSVLFKEESGSGKLVGKDSVNRLARCVINTISFYSEDSLEGGTWENESDGVERGMQSIVTQLQKMQTQIEDTSRVIGALHEKIDKGEGRVEILSAAFADWGERVVTEIGDIKQTLAEGLSFSTDNETTASSEESEEVVSFKSEYGTNKSPRGQMDNAIRRPDEGPAAGSTSGVYTIPANHSPGDTTNQAQQNSFYKGGEHGEAWTEVQAQSRFRHHTMQGEEPVLAMGKQRDLGGAYAVGVADEIPMVSPEAPATRNKAGESGGHNSSSDNFQHGWGSGAKKDTHFALGIQEWPITCNTGELPKFLRHIAEIHSPGRVKGEALNHFQGTRAMQAALMSLKRTSSTHPALQVLEDRGLLNETADPLSWNAMVANLYARFVNEDQITKVVGDLQQSSQNKHEKLEVYFRRCLKMGEACGNQMTKTAIANKILGGMIQSPAKTDLSSRVMASQWPNAMKTQADLVAVAIECWLPVARAHSHSSTGVSYTEAPKDWEKPQGTQQKQHNAPTTTGAKPNTESSKRVKCKKCHWYHKPGDACSPKPSNGEKPTEGKSVDPQPKTTVSKDGGKGGSG